MGHLDVGDPPVVLFQGTLAYKPNTDAADWLVKKIAPRIWENDPSVTVRLAGILISEVEALHNPPSVTVVGRVPSMERELSRADIAPFLSASAADSSEDPRVFRPSGASCVDHHRG